MRLGLYITIVLSALILHCPLYATIRNIHIELPASNKQVGREQALDQARDVALKQYIDLHPENKSQLTVLLGDPVGLAKIIKSTHVVKEKFERQRYVCFVDVTFNHENLTRYVQVKSKPTHKNLSQILGGGNETMAINPHTSKGMLIIPVFISEDESLLWEDNNKWRLSWQDQESTFKGKFTVPLADLRDQTMCSIEDAMVERKAGLRALGERYHQPLIIVSILKQLGNSDNYELVVKTFNHNGQIKVFEPYHMDNVKKLSHEARFRHAQHLTLEIVAKGVVPDNVQPDAALLNIQDPCTPDEEIPQVTTPVTVEKSVKQQDNVTELKNTMPSIDSRQTPVDPDVVSNTQRTKPINTPKVDGNPSINIKTPASTAPETDSAEVTLAAPVQQNLNYTIKFSSLGQLNTLRNTIKKITGVSNFRINNLNLNQANISFNYTNPDSDFTSELGKHGIKTVTRGTQKILEMNQVQTPVVPTPASFDDAALGY